MSQSSDFRELGRGATAIYEMVGDSGATYIFFWFEDHSICALKRLYEPTSGVAARWEFGAIKPGLDDCGLTDFEGTTYQKGRELLRRLRGEK